MEKSDHEAKLRDCLDHAMPKEQGERLLRELDRLSVDEVKSVVTSFLAVPHAHP